MAPIPISLALASASHCGCCCRAQGAVLTSSERGPIRIQFSKNPFGKKRDVSGQLIDTRMSAGGSAMDGMGAYDPTQAAV